MVKLKWNRNKLSLKKQDMLLTVGLRPPRHLVVFKWPSCNEKFLCIGAD